jgi:galactokinase/N-acetylgalactosamine kinase
MDQAASVMSDPASALYISFYPALKASPASLPPGVVFVIANSLVISDKAVTAKTNYNLRVVETLVAARVLARTFGVEVGQERITLREVVGKYSGETPGNWLSVEKLATALEDVLEKLDVLKAREGSRSGVTMEEMVEMSGLAPDAFHRIYLSWIDGKFSRLPSGLYLIRLPVKATHFVLYKRAKHVFSEALRVLQFRQVCLESQDSTEGDAAGYRRKLGDLMNESQESCAELFNCSCPEIDQLTKLARSAGAIGSRLTGKWSQGSDFKRR